MRPWESGGLQFFLSLFVRNETPAYPTFFLNGGVGDWLRLHIGPKLADKKPKTLVSATLGFSYWVSSINLTKQGTTTFQKLRDPGSKNWIS